MKPQTVFSAYIKATARYHVVSREFTYHGGGLDAIAAIGRYGRLVRRCEAWLERYFDRVESLVYADADTTWKQVAEAMDDNAVIAYLEGICAERLRIIERFISENNKLKAENARLLRVMLDAVGVEQ